MRNVTKPVFNPHLHYMHINRQNIWFVIIVYFDNSAQILDPRLLCRSPVADPPWKLNLGG